MDKKLDFRVQRTYKALLDTLIDLMSEKKFEDITVGELCERAMIRRATFYKHFGDKYELFTFAIRELQEEFIQKNAPEYDKDNPKAFYLNMIDYSLQFVEDHADMLRSLMKSNSSHVLFNILSNEIEVDIRIHLRQDARGGAPLPAKPELLAAMITGALVNTMKWWVIQDMQPSKEELMDVCVSLIKVV